MQTALRELGAKETVVVSRTGENNYNNLYERHADAALLVNATPVGMAPKTGERLVRLEALPALEAVVDLIYNPARTGLLLDAERLGLPAVNGLGMLVAQAAASCELFCGRRCSDGEIEEIRAALARETQNVLLIGMPGCGKSTVGAALASRMGRELCDLDEEIEKRAGRTVPELFASEGEEGFRRREHEVLCEAVKRSGLVIAAGGGVVTREENFDLLRQNARVVWLRRDLALLPTEGRPLSQTVPLTELYRRREPLYRAAADLTIENDGTPEKTAERILELH